jgi:hypothetical protein
VRPDILPSSVRACGRKYKRTVATWFEVYPLSSFSIIHDTALEMRRRIFAALEATPDTDFGLNGSIDRIRIAGPAEDLPNGTVAALFLYHIEIDKHLRNQRPLIDRGDPSLQRRDCAIG